jgi:nitrous oxidase accessory protein NosD
MQKLPAALMAACLLSTGLWACQPGDSGSGDTSTQQPAAATPRGAVPQTGTPPASSGTPAASPQPAEPPLIGAQPVPDTPVANLPPHDGHSPIAEPSPQPPTHAEEPVPPAPTFSREWVVSTSGTDTAEGSAAHPFRTLSKAVSVAGPGELIRVLAGTYPERLVLGSNVKAGTAGAKITLQGEGKPRLVPDSGVGALVQVRRPGWVIDGFELDVQGEAMFGVTFEGDVTGSVLANSELHHGAGGAGITTFNQARGATIENNNIHDFVKRTGDLDSHGIVVQPTSRDITVRNNDIHDNSGDSVQCLGPEGFSSLPPAQGLRVENNHLYGNRENAVDIKTCWDVTVRNNRMHHFKPTSTAKGEAVVVHMSARNVLIEDNEVYDAGKGIAVGGNHTGPVPTGVVIRRNRIHDLSTAGGGEGTGIRLENSKGAQVVNNTITDAAGVALMLGYGTGGATESLTVENNIINSPVAVSVGSMHPGLKMGFNLYSAAAQFKLGGSLEALEPFKQAVGDTTSSTGDAAVAPNFAPSTVAVDKGTDVGLPFCGSGPDIGAVELGCAPSA